MLDQIQHAGSVGEWGSQNINCISLNEDSLNLLFRNMIPYIRVPCFASDDECEAITREASKEGFSPYRNVEPKINKIGNTVFEYDRISADKYFDSVDSISAIQQRIFSNSFNPVERLSNLIQSITDSRPEVAQTTKGKPYYAGLIRRIEKGTQIHVDYAPTEQSSWEVCDVICQLSWNLYLRVSDPDEGHTHIYNKQWESGHNHYREGVYGYAPEVVKDCDSVTFNPVVGDLVIFNTRNYHAVDDTRGERVTVTSALGLLPNGRLILWS